MTNPAKLRAGEPSTTHEKAVAARGNQCDWAIAIVITVIAIGALASAIATPFIGSFVAHYSFTIWGPATGVALLVAGMLGVGAGFSIKHLKSLKPIEQQQ